MDPNRILVRWTNSLFEKGLQRYVYRYLEEERVEWKLTWLNSSDDRLKTVPFT